MSDSIQKTLNSRALSSFYIFLEENSSADSQCTSDFLQSWCLRLEALMKIENVNESENLLYNKDAGEVNEVEGREKMVRAHSLNELSSFSSPVNTYKMLMMGFQSFFVGLKGSCNVEDFVSDELHQILFYTHKNAKHGENDFQRYKTEHLFTFSNSIPGQGGPKHEI
jgi:hypothetical protein